MIRLDVEEYCHLCFDFQPDVIAAERTFAADTDDIIQTDTVVQCKYRKRCEAIKRYLIQQAREEAVG